VRKAQVSPDAAVFTVLVSGGVPGWTEELDR
jgi:hypothetical protein